MFKVWKTEPYTTIYDIVHRGSSHKGEALAYMYNCMSYPESSSDEEIDLPARNLARNPDRNPDRRMAAGRVILREELEEELQVDPPQEEPLTEGEFWEKVAEFKENTKMPVSNTFKEMYRVKHDGLSDIVQVICRDTGSRAIDYIMSCGPATYDSIMLGEMNEVLKFIVDEGRLFSDFTRLRN